MNSGAIFNRVFILMAQWYSLQNCSADLLGVSKLPQHPEWEGGVGPLPSRLCPSGKDSAAGPSLN